MVYSVSINRCVCCGLVCLRVLVWVIERVSLSECGERSWIEEKRKRRLLNSDFRFVSPLNARASALLSFSLSPPYSPSRSLTFTRIEAITGNNWRTKQQGLSQHEANVKDVKIHLIMDSLKPKPPRCRLRQISLRTIYFENTVHFMRCFITEMPSYVVIK